MKRYFPFFRGKQNELIALRELANEIAESGKVIPIIEPVKANTTTRISLDRYVEASMPFLLICNPDYGDFANQPQQLYDTLITEALLDGDSNWTPALILRANSSATVISAFLERYEDYEVALIYYGLPASTSARALLNAEGIANHVFIGNSVGAAYVNTIQDERRVMVGDRFQRQPRNADYPDREFFTDWNTVDGNPSRIDFGDFSIVGDDYSENGGPAYAVAVHHIHYQQGTAGPLDVSHFISDSNETTANPSGKVIEAVTKLVEALDEPLLPNDTAACDEYRDMADTEVSRGLGYLKRLAIKHHLEIMLSGGIQL